MDGVVEILVNRVEDTETDADNDITKLSVPNVDEENDMLWQDVYDATSELVDASDCDGVSVVDGQREAEDDAEFEEVADTDDVSLGDAETDFVI